MEFTERKPMTPEPAEKPREEGPGPRRPDVDVGGTDDLMKRMRKVDPKQAERYRQRTGE